MTTDRSTLHQHDGRPVPWVTRWTGEINQDPAQISMNREGVFLRYPEGGETRDEHGVLWKREGIGRQGEPQYSEMNTYRQRASMNKRLCQICGSKIDERPIRWLMSRKQLERTEDTALTMSPPTCSDCIPLALELCPHLRSEGYLILKVLEYETWGVMGQAVFVDHEQERWREIRGYWMPYYEENLIAPGAISAYQQVVELVKFSIEIDAPGKGGNGQV